MKDLSLKRWQQIDALFAEALDLPPDERSAFLREACGDDPSLYREVVALLETTTEAEAALGGSAESYAASLIENMREELSEEQESEQAGSRIGVYRLVREIGRGGMGAVYLAERADGQFEQHVAIKVVKRGMDTDEVLRRFRTERQILAALHHPNIARLFDGGMTADGRPYLVMEHVEGLPIDRYCDEHALSIERRLQLFEKVCEAVQYAHRNLVVHRDLKPSNILVGDGDRVKLLDFGIARLLSDETPVSAALTRTGVRVMTPAYAAPEQITASPITTATDVYALGIILFELLTGQRPYYTAGESPSAVERAILAETPERPSVASSKSATEARRGDGIMPEAASAARGTTRDGLCRRLKGDLDVIVMKALRKEPESRYASVEALRDDIRRHLNRLPIAARPPTFAYRARTFFDRHRIAVSAATVFVGLLATFSIFHTVQVTQERDVARLERDKAENVTAFLTDLFSASDPLLASTSEQLDTLRVRHVLDRGAEKIRRDLEGRHVLQAAMLSVVGEVYHNLGLYDEAQSLLEHGLEQSRIAHQAPNLETAETLVKLADVLLSKSEYDSAEQNYRDALSILKDTEGPQSLAAARAMVSLAGALRARGDFDEAERLGSQALAIQHAQLGGTHIDLASTHLELGRVFQDRGHPIEAEQHFREALAQHRRLLESDDLRTNSIVESLATVLREQMKFEEAEPLLRESLARRQRILGAEHPRTLTARYELAALLRDKGDLEEAAGLFREVVDLDRKVLGEDHHYVGQALQELAITLARMGAFDEALQRYDEALAIFRESVPDNEVNLTIVLSGMGYTYLQMGDPARGEPLLREALEMRIATLGEASWRTGVSKSVLGECMMALGRYDEAETLLIEGYETLRESNGPTDAAVRRIIALYDALDSPARAEEYRALVAADQG